MDSIPNHDTLLDGPKNRAENRQPQWEDESRDEDLWEDACDEIDDRSEFEPTEDELNG